MPCTDDTEWRTGRLAKLRDMIDAYDDAVLALSTGAQMYQLDTGQTRQMVQKSQLSQLRSMRDALLNEYETLRARLCGGSTHVVGH